MIRARKVVRIASTMTDIDLLLLPVFVLIELLNSIMLKPITSMRSNFCMIVVEIVKILILEFWEFVTSEFVRWDGVKQTQGRRKISRKVLCSFVPLLLCLDQLVPN